MVPKIYTLKLKKKKTKGKNEWFWAVAYTFHQHIAQFFHFFCQHTDYSLFSSIPHDYTKIFIYQDFYIQGNIVHRLTAWKEKFHTGPSHPITAFKSPSCFLPGILSFHHWSTWASSNNSLHNMASTCYGQAHPLHQNDPFCSQHVVLFVLWQDLVQEADQLENFTRSWPCPWVTVLHILH